MMRPIVRKDKMSMKTDYTKQRDYLLDEESRSIFDARIEYMQSEDTLTYIRKMLKLYGDFRYPALDEFVERRESIENGFFIAGAGYEGGIASEILNCTKYASFINGFFDNNRNLWGKVKNNLPIMSIYEIQARKKDTLFILASAKYNQQFFSQLISLGVSQNNIFIPSYGGFLSAIRGWQYFDMFEPEDHEVFVDAGAYDGMTSKDFLRWCNGIYDAIHMFELNADMKPVCLANIGETEKISFKGKGVWDKDTFLWFRNSQNSAHVKEENEAQEGCDLAEVCAIDSELEGEKITFIKMDVEGSELKALHGAEKTIKDLKPRLAISVYHKLNDLITIMDYLIHLNPEYGFYLRHYSACQWETVLYAVSGE